MGSSGDLVIEIKTPCARVSMLGCFNQNFQFSLRLAGKLKTQDVFNTSSQRKQVHHKTPENALACAASLY